MLIRRTSDGTAPPASRASVSEPSSWAMPGYGALSACNC